MPELSEVKAYDISQDAANTYAEEMGTKTGLGIKIVKTPKEAVEDSDAIVTAGPIHKEPIPAIERDWLKPGFLPHPLILIPISKSLHLSILANS